MNSAPVRCSLYMYNVHAVYSVCMCMMSIIAPEVGLAGQAVRDGRRAGAPRLGGAPARLHGGAAHPHRRVPHHLQAAARPVQAVPAGARSGRFR